MPSPNAMSGSAKTKAAKHAKSRKKDLEAAGSLPDGLPDFGDYGTGILEQRFKKLLAQAQGAKSGGDTEAIHQMRVWSRRSRAALDVFGDCFRGHTAHAFAQMEREVKNVTRALGEARDLDVMMDTLRVRAESLPPEQRGGVESFSAYLHAQRDERQQAVTRAVQRLEKRRLKRVLRRAAHRQGYTAVTLAAPSEKADSEAGSGGDTAQNAHGPTVRAAAPDAGHTAPVTDALVGDRREFNGQKPGEGSPEPKNSERNHHA